MLQVLEIAILQKPQIGIQHHGLDVNYRPERLAMSCASGLRCSQYRGSNARIMSCSLPGILLMCALSIFFFCFPNLHRRALRDELFPMDEPARHHVCKEVAAVVMRAFDRENPESNIQDETVVTVRIDRHGYIKETPYIAGDLRAANLNELTIMTQRFLSDPVVMSGTLEAGPDLGPYRASDVAAPRPEAKKAKGKRGECTAASSVAVTTNLSRANVGGKKRARSKAEGCRVETGEDGELLPWLWGIHLESEEAAEATTMRLKMKLGVVSVNGEECVSRKKIKIVRGVAVNAPNMVALR